VELSGGVGGTRTGSAALDDLRVLAERAVSPAADELFTVGCGAPGVGPRVTLEREILAVETALPRNVHESVEVVGCDAPVIGQLRAQLNLLRSSVMGD
jgi:hypothetical protein